jgi:hypothetical protein
MFFLLRMGFWLTVVCVLLPSSGGKQTSPDAQIDATQAVTLASAAVSDMSGFCDRQPQACAAGGKVAAAIGYKAEAGARTIYQFINARLSQPSSTTAADTEVATNRSAAAPRVTSVSTTGSTGHRSTTGTLTASDLQPAWRGPVPLPPRRENRAGRPAA